MSELDSVSDAPSKENRGAAWNPTYLAWLVLLFSVFPIGIFYALNFERLGQSERKKRALISVCLVSAIFYCASARLWMRDSMESNSDLGLRFWFHIIGLAIAWRFYLPQQAAFVRHMRSGGAKASLWVPILWSLTWFAAVSGGIWGWETWRETQNNKEFNRALALMNRGQDKAAAEVFQLYKLRDPDEASTYWNLALIYERTNRSSLAAAELKALLKIDPNYQKAKTFLRDIEM